MSHPREDASAEVPGQGGDLSRCQRERDLYWQLLELGTRDDLEQVLAEALSLIVEVTRAQKGYVALYSRGGDGCSPRYAIARGCSAEELEGIRERISSGIIAEAIATGQTLLTGSASGDPRFRDFPSVQANSIGAVLCAPIGRPAIGVLYLQDRPVPLSFGEIDRARAEAFARHLAPFLDRLLIRHAAEATRSDPTAPFRQRLELGGLIGRSRALAKVFQLIDNAARFEATVLLTGASGTGKTAVARAIHQSSGRAAGPFVELNCAAVPDALFESELFGALAGAHSTANRKVEGKIDAAEGGTLFLDEVGELSPAVQGKLLQFLGSREFYPLGAARAKKANVRLIAATNRDLEASVAARTFREDLYYRLNVLAIRMPALSERPEDLRLLATHFAAQTAQSYALSGLQLSEMALLCIEEADWPGNARQLAHAIEAAGIRAAAEGAGAIEGRHLFGDAATDASNGPNEDQERVLPYQEATRRFQRKLVLEALERVDWNVSAAARRLGLTRAHVYNLIEALKLRTSSGG
jgi:Nif-specific regulatory protein